MNFSLFAILCFCLLFISCNKCIECTATQNIDGVVIETPFDKYCSKTENLDLYERNLNASTGNKATITCIRF